MESAQNNTYLSLKYVKLHHLRDPVIPAKAGIQEASRNNWIPAFAGMTIDLLANIFVGVLGGSSILGALGGSSILGALGGSNILGVLSATAPCVPSRGLLLAL